MAEQIDIPINVFEIFQVVLHMNSPVTMVNVSNPVSDATKSISAQICLMKWDAI